jgi:D-xylose 1-dehydrogenase (NADP+, D-xylono-1,5-lactone-forming)
VTPIRLGLLTTANINRHVLATRSDDAPYRFVAVGSRDQARADAYAREWGIEQGHGSYEDLLRDDGVDAVYIALPNKLHHEWTMRALGAGKHVLCEKPYTRNPPDVEEAWSEAERRGLVVMEAFMWRHNPQTTKLLELLPRIGELQEIHATFSFRLTEDVNVRLLGDLGGGSLLDVGCYCVSGARLLAGREPDRVYAEAVYGRGGVDENFAAVLRFGDVLATIHSGFRSVSHSLLALGSDGKLSTFDPWVSTDPVVRLNDEEHVVERISSYRLELENFVAAIRGEAQPLLGKEESLGQARTLDALLRSAETNEPVTLG